VRACCAGRATRAGAWTSRARSRRGTRDGPGSTPDRDG
jgi:hypothetical protein